MESTKFPFLAVFVSFVLLNALFAQEYKSNSCIRSQRSLAVSLEAGWNTLSGTGLNLHYYLFPNACLDIAYGLGFSGPKYGGRARFLFSPKHFAPYLSMGMISHAGDTLEGDNAAVIVRPCRFLQCGTGFEYITNWGLLFGLNVGYAFAMGKDDVCIYYGGFEEKTKKLMGFLYSSGPVFGLNIGYAFRLRSLFPAQ